MAEVERRDGQNKLSKTIRNRNLKFSVEIHNDGDEHEQYDEDFETEEENNLETAVSRADDERSGKEDAENPPEEERIEVTNTEVHKNNHEISETRHETESYEVDTEQEIIDKGHEVSNEKRDINDNLHETHMAESDVNNHQDISPFSSQNIEHISSTTKKTNREQNKQKTEQNHKDRLNNETKDADYKPTKPKPKKIPEKEHKTPRETRDKLPAINSKPEHVKGPKRKFDASPRDQSGDRYETTRDVKLPHLDQSPRRSPNNPPKLHPSNIGPGPAHYQLPTTVGRNQADLTKKFAPAFSFGSRSWSFKSDSPGPAYNPMFSSSQKGTPSFSFGYRPKTPVKKDIVPGPGAYDTANMAPTWERKAPAFSMAYRNKLRSVDQAPPPNTYLLPSTLGNRVPHQPGGIAVSMYERREKLGYAEDLAKTPGPAGYTLHSDNSTKKRSPQFSMLGRNFVPTKYNPAPGPGTYNPQNVTSHLERSPKHVIGVRHSEFVMPTITPADVD
ncbi:uncharacterized protein LOC127851127 isoform X2 [Dreissena polymorpha]|uniref:Uncharacterized protein n=1 Tax=Dreissena polymorpha TaxID=45954 RepID=A0A9D4D0K0_DREPO|nr:uncharacterized protein LOC127851127 isoform X2 [Dreissena polymorpha]KAH3735740.1 hypothetical protein DPMN_042275 [Dreissena polymorpha]